MLPDWAPNVHPLVVPFPVALLVVAALVDAVALAVRQRAPWVRASAVGLYALGALGTAAAFLTGRDASESVDLPAAALPTLNAHADGALWLVWFAGLYAAARVAALWLDGRGREPGRLAVHAPLAAVGLVGLFLVYETAEHGGELVYHHGVAVAATAPALEAPPDTALAARLDVLAGAPAEGPVFTVASGRPTLAVLPDTLGDLEARAALDLSGFTGTAALVYAVQSPADYDFLALDTAASGPATLRQGRASDGVETTMDQRTAALDGPAELRASAVGTHFRGYLGGEQLTHPHGPAPPPGRVGLRLDGAGTVRVLALSSTPVE
ncbi:DUF2231 domain-containing protein [Rubrivirga marina]|uniref:DUF2231 domain-containing protein n=1 Tax=Rubrivirga marina TaxID=1196024 RepID=A0A271IYL2_9BACT|nr:DUF2231 domain-containing protein [Rubrivirga marina]PAP76341.1 hypothetical protein BSZ37_07730 [Rubrivirga marina]